MVSPNHSPIHSPLETYLKTHPKTHLIFDLDETLCWLILPWQHWEDKIKPQLLTLNKTIFQTFEHRKISLSELQNHYIAKFPATKQLFIKHNTWFETTVVKEVFPNLQLLQFITHNQHTKKYTFYVWSSNTKKTTTTVLKKYNLQHQFKKIITRNDVTMLKPNPEGFKSIKKKSIPLNQYLFIGDSKSDKQAAQAIGIDFFNITYFNQKKFKKFRSNHKIKLN